MDVKKLKEKVEEMLNKDSKADPVIVERVNQIFNDAIASMPPVAETATTKETPEDALVRRLKAQIEAVKSDTSPELAKKLKEVLAAVEPELKKNPNAAPIPSAAPIPPKPVAPAPQPKT